MASLVLADPWRRDVLRIARDRAGPEFWIGAGFVRNPVWDRLYGVAEEPLADVDVIYFDPEDPDPIVREREWERLFGLAQPDVPWQVRNQARMHLVNGGAPATSLTEALEQWAETATAVAVRLTGAGGLDVAAPFGLSDLMERILRPPRMTSVGQAAMLDRARRKGWFRRWPDLTVKIESANCGQFGRE